MKKILIIDDSDELREIVTDMLELEGFDTVQARDGLEGMAKAIRDQPDAILCDLSMPQLNGYQLLYRLRACAETATIPFIFVTAHRAINTEYRGLDVDLDGHLVKPFNHHELMSALMNGIGARPNLA